MLIGTTEKVPYGLTLVAHGTSGYGSRPLPDNAIGRLSNPLSRIMAWPPPMRLNDTRIAPVDIDCDPARSVWRSKPLISSFGGSSSVKFWLASWNKEKRAKQESTHERYIRDFCCRPNLEIYQHRRFALIIFLQRTCRPLPKSEPPLKGGSPPPDIFYRDTPL